MTAMKFVRPRLEDAERIMNWRTSPRVTEFMVTDFEPDLAAQKEWLKQMSGLSTYEHWIVVYRDRKIGLVNLSPLPEAPEKAADWGYYIGEPEMTILGASIPLYFYNYIFGVRGMERLYANVAEPNEAVYRLHTSQGYTEVGRIERGIDKPALTCDMLRLELKRSSWEANATKFARYSAEWEQKNPAL